jgi:hypothetical protein
MRFPGPCWRLRHRLSVPADTPDKVALVEDIAVTVDLGQEAHSARPMWRPNQAYWAVAKVAEAWAPLALAPRIADKLSHLRAWKPHT